MHLHVLMCHYDVALVVVYFLLVVHLSESLGCADEGRHYQAMPPTDRSIIVWRWALLDMLHNGHVILEFFVVSLVNKHLQGNWSSQRAS